MSLPKKNSRSITVRDRVYRWMVKPTVDRNRVRLTVQDETTGELHQRTVSDWDDGESAPPVTPATVKEFIIERFPES
jgi:hypothetical protein